MITSLRANSGGGRGVAEPVDLVVDRGVLLDVEVLRRDVGLGLVVVVVADEVLDGVLGEELAELVAELRRQRLVVGDHQRRAAGAARSSPAIVKVLPVPVAPSRVWKRSFASSPSASPSIAFGWSAVARVGRIELELGHASSVAGARSRSRCALKPGRYGYGAVYAQVPWACTLPGAAATTTMKPSRLAPASEPIASPVRRWASSDIRAAVEADLACRSGRRVHGSDACRIVIGAGGSDREVDRAVRQRRRRGCGQADEEVNVVGVFGVRHRATTPDSDDCGARGNHVAEAPHPVQAVLVHVRARDRSILHLPARDGVAGDLRRCYRAIAELRRGHGAVLDLGSLDRVVLELHPCRIGTAAPDDKHGKDRDHHVGARDPRVPLHGRLLPRHGRRAPSGRQEAELRPSACRAPYRAVAPRAGSG